MDGHATQLDRRSTNADTQPRAWLADVRADAKKHFSEALTLGEDCGVRWQASTSDVLINPWLLFRAEFNPSHVTIQRHNPRASLGRKTLQRMIRAGFLPRRLLDSQPS